MKIFGLNLEDNLFIPGFSSALNDLRRTALEKLENIIIEKSEKSLKNVEYKKFSSNIKTNNTKNISILLNTISENMDYSSLTGVSQVYIPFKYYLDTKYSTILSEIENKFNTYIYMPIIMRQKTVNVFNQNVENILKAHKILGFVISNLSDVSIVSKYNLEVIGNYTLNVFNTNTIKELENLGMQKYTASPELDKQTLNNLFMYNENISSEMIVYERTPLMTSNYCLLGKSNKCYSKCSSNCNSSKHYLKDRMNFKFPVYPDNLGTITTIYNSKITCIPSNDVYPNSYRVDILDENLEEIQNIIDTVLSGNRLEGQDYTNGNLGRIV